MLQVILRLSLEPLKFQCHGRAGISCKNEERSALLLGVQGL